METVFLSCPIKNTILRYTKGIEHNARFESNRLTARSVV